MSLLRFVAVPSRQMSRFARPFRRDFMPLASMINDMQRMMLDMQEGFWGSRPERFDNLSRRALRQPHQQSSDELASLRSKADKTDATPSSASAQTTSANESQAPPASTDTAPSSSNTQVARSDQPNHRGVRAHDPFDFDDDFGLPALFSRDLMPRWATQEMRTWNPRLDAVEEDKQYKLAVELPGVRKEDVKIRIGQDGYGSRTLTLSAERRSVWEDDEAQTVDTESKAAAESGDTATATSAESKASEAPSHKQSGDRRVSYASFTRTLTLPDDVDVSQISAKQDHGVLRLVLPKLERPPAKEHEVSVQ